MKYIRLDNAPHDDAERAAYEALSHLDRYGQEVDPPIDDDAEYDDAEYDDAEFDDLPF